LSKVVKTTNASLVIIGTSVGAGILGLPVETGRGGFMLSLLFFFLVWVVMTVTALMLTEVLSEFEGRANFFTLAEEKLGSFFKTLTFLVYTALYLSLTLAYIKGGGVFFSDLSDRIPLPLGCSIFLILFTPIITFGAKVLGFGNSVLTFSMFVSFALLTMLGIKEIESSLLLHFNWKFAFFSLPMFVTSFGFHNVLPSLFSYVGSKKHVQVAVCIGTTVTFSIYLIWQMVVLGIVPLDGENSLMQAFIHDQTAISPLYFYLKRPLLIWCAQVFYFAALTTSFLGVGLGLIDFLLDALKIKRQFINRLFLTILIYVPAIWIAQTKLRIFYLSVKYGAGMACVYLLIILPILLFFACKWKRKGKLITVDTVDATNNTSERSQS